MKKIKIIECNPEAVLHNGTDKASWKVGMLQGAECDGRSWLRKGRTADGESGGPLLKGGT